MADCTGVILAAGYGRRMGGLGASYPKTLLPVGDKAILNHHVDLLADLGISNVIIIVGHREEQIAATVAEVPRDVNIQRVRQEEPLGSAHALSLVRPLITNPVIVLLGDYYFRASNPAAMLRHLDQGVCAIAVKREPDTRLIAEACAVMVDSNNRVTEIVEKPMVPRTPLKGCGMYACTMGFFDTLARTPRTALRNEYELTTALELHVGSGNALFAEEIVQWDANLTRPVDLLECNLRWLKETRQPSFVAMDAHLDRGAVVTSAIVGAHATIGSGARISHSVVFPSAIIAAGAAVERAIVTPSEVVQC